MVYAFQVEFDIRPDQMNELQVGASLGRALGYLRALLPDQPGFISASGLSSLDTPGKIHLVLQSLWQTWEDLLAHRQSALAENQVLFEFQPHVTVLDLTVHAYAEAG